MIYTLTQISQNGIQEVLGTDFNLGDIIVAGEKLKELYPDLKIGITDQFGFFIWPMELNQSA